MSACHIKCPFCKASPSVGYFYKHLISIHITELFDSDTDYGKNNLRWLNNDKVRSSPYTLYLPKNEFKYCCPECNVAFNKVYYAEKHVKCLPKCLEKQEEYKLLLKITPALPPFTEKVPIEAPKSNEMAEFREKVYQKIIYNLLAELGDKEEWAYWFNKMCDDDEIHKYYKENFGGQNMDEDEKYDFNTENSKELKLLGINLSTILDTGKRRLPNPPS